MPTIATAITSPGTRSTCSRSSASSRTASHAFYLGVELARAQVAHQLGKRYVQDNELRWGVAVPPPAEDRLHFVQAGSTLAARRKARRRGELMPFIRESIVTTLNADGSAHVAPLGVIVEEPFLVIAPFHPSTTLDNLRRHRLRLRQLHHRRAGVRRLRDPPAAGLAGGAGGADRGLAAGGCPGPQRGRGGGGGGGRAAPTVPLPRRARGQPRAVPRASIAPRRRCWRRRSWSRACTCCRPTKVEGELRYLQIAIDKTAGEAEREAWGWLMAGRGRGWDLACPSRASRGGPPGPWASSGGGDSIGLTCSPKGASHKLPQVANQDRHELAIGTTS